MTDSILRFLTMRRMLPRAPRKIDTVTMEGKLRDEGCTVTRRTTQRDLHQLARAFPLLCDEHRRVVLGHGYCAHRPPGSGSQHGADVHAGHTVPGPLLPHSTSGRIQP